MKKSLLSLLTISLVGGLILLAGCAKEKSEPAKQAAAEQLYTCPMHPQIISNKPGNCPICNMQLVPKKETGQESMQQSPDSAKIVYTCPMHPEIVSDTPGVCPKCNMTLEPIEKTSPDTTASQGHSSVQQYTCGMHPQIVSNEPGNCPICHMKLVPKADVTQTGGTIRVDAATQMKMGMATSAVVSRKLSKTVRANGKVNYSEPNLASINIKFGGWVEKLYANETGAHVEKGQPLLEIYSPELVAAQKEYLIAWNTMNGMHMNDSVPSQLINAAGQKLKNWDISEEQIYDIAKTKEVKHTLTINSPLDGIVTEKSVQQGDNVMAGQELFKIANLSTVWVSAYIYEQDMPFVHKGQAARVSTPSIPGEFFNSNIIYVSPFLDDSRQAEIRLAVNNANWTLKPNMSAEVNIKSELAGESLTIPRSAIIKSGIKEIVFVAMGNDAFEGREIISGIVSESDLVEVKSGLQEGEQVVTSGQFMLDSESRLNEVIAGSGHVQSGPHAGMDMKGTPK